VILRDNADEVAARRVTAAWVRSVRTQLGLTQARFAKALGVRRSTVTGWENAACEPRLTSMAAIRALDINEIQALFDMRRQVHIPREYRVLAGNSPRRAEGMG
jgi:DNA-binding transcriptional regulator YiaG